MDPDADDAKIKEQPPAPPAAAPRGQRREIVRLFGQLYPPAKLDELVFLLEMPLGTRPAATLTIDERRNAVLQWAESPVGPGLVRLEEELRFLIPTQQT
jgi:hypothetical protein